MRLISLLLLALVCCSCATVKTVEPQNNHVQVEHRGKKSGCDDIPRVYSGTAYSLCLLNGEPSYRKNVGHSVNGVPFIVIDAAFSAVADTLVLPYTLVQQMRKGNIDVN